MLGALLLLLLFPEPAPAQDLSYEPNGNLNLFDHRDFETVTYTLHALTHRIFDRNNWILDNLDNTTESGFSWSFEFTLKVIKESVCARSRGECSLALGCSCDQVFRTLRRERGNQCRNLPCRGMEYIYENGAKAFGDQLRTVNSFEELMKWVVRNIFPAFQTFLCPCTPQVYKAVTQCLLTYDGEFWRPQEIEVFNDMVSSLDMESIRNAMGTWTDMLCSDSGQCVEEFGELLVQIGVMLDNSFDKDHPDQCQSFRRMSPAILDSYFRFVAADDYTFSSAIGIMGYDTVKEFWCGEASCAAHLDETFNTCCARKLDQVVNAIKLRETIQALESLFKSNVFAVSKVARESVRLIFDEIGPEVELKKLKELTKPHKLCGELYQSKACV